ncbi:IclR family transcriptional regulator [Nocardia sp. NPDC051787]|uniref:IclR family transcriptional regulator n=1 Tax=Nocardia sp. NPDC051787 TaxID=3155415 RepID=UPI00344A3575
MTTIDNDENRQQTRRSGVQSVDRAFAVLDVLGHSSEPLTVQEVAKRGGLDRTVAHRLLKTLKCHNAVVESNGSYRLGPQTVLMATRYTESLLVRRLALPYMLDLQMRELVDSPITVNLSIAVGDVSAVVERIWTPTAPLDLVISSGDLFPLERTATGRSILAVLDESEVDAAIGTDRHASVKEILAETKANDGVAISRSEAIPGVVGLAAAIVAPGGKPVAAIGISCPEPQSILAPDSDIAAKLARNVRAIGRMLP